MSPAQRDKNGRFASPPPPKPSLTASVGATIAGVHPKVAAGGAGGAVAVLLIWAANLLHVDLPPEVAAALTTVVAFAAAYVKGA